MDQSAPLSTSSIFAASFDSVRCRPGGHGLLGPHVVVAPVSGEGDELPWPTPSITDNPILLPSLITSSPPRSLQSTSSSKAEPTSKDDEPRTSTKQEELFHTTNPIFAMDDKETPLDQNGGHHQLPLPSGTPKATQPIEHESEEAIAMKAKEQLLNMKLNVDQHGSIKSYNTKNAPSDPYMALYRKQQADAATSMCCCLF